MSEYDVAITDEQAEAAIDALAVLVFTPGIRQHLLENDPMALRQAEFALWKLRPKAVEAYYARYPEGGDNVG